jgi:hypothetical protein
LFAPDRAIKRRERQKRPAFIDYLYGNCLLNTTYYGFLRAKFLKKMKI